MNRDEEHGRLLSGLSYQNPWLRIREYEHAIDVLYRFDDVLEWPMGEQLNWTLIDTARGDMPERMRLLVDRSEYGADICVRDSSSDPNQQIVFVTFEIDNEDREILEAENG